MDDEGTYEEQKRQTGKTVSGVVSDLAFSGQERFSGLYADLGAFNQKRGPKTQLQKTQLQKGPGRRKD